MKAINRKPVVTDVANQIRAAILEGGLKPGAKVPQDQLAAALGVSRLPIRQALLVLQREGLVFLDHGRGAVVAPLDITFISDLFDWRAVVDSHVAGVLASRRNFDPSVLRRIIAEGRAATERGEPRRDLVMDFHTAQYEAVGNQVLLRIMKPLLDHVQRVVTLVQSVGQNGGDRPAARIDGARRHGLRAQPETWAEHEAILDAIAARRVGRARALARAHVQQVKQVVVTFLVSNAAASNTPLRRGRRLTRKPELTVTFGASDAE